LSTPPDIEGFFTHGIGLDGSSVRGFAHIMIRTSFCFLTGLLLG
jgi:hypothetical protein